jgi:hypothetical protein
VPRIKPSAEQVIRGILARRHDWFATSSIGVMSGGTIPAQKRAEILADMVKRGEVLKKVEMRRGKPILFYKLVR